MRRRPFILRMNRIPALQPIGRFSMTDEAQRLRNAINELHQALQSAHGVDPDTRSLLARTVSEVREVLETQPGAAANNPDEMAERVGRLPVQRQLAKAAAEFEGSHPTLAGTVRSVIDALAQIGI